MNRCPIFCFAILSAALSSALAHAGDDAKPLLTILYTGEVHAALLPCDCPLQPLGGVARRATLIQRYRERGPVVLVDAGGWSAGGIYDEGTNGDEHRDALRNDLTLKAMRLMNYDAAASSQMDEKAVADANGQFPAKAIATAMPLVLKDRFEIPVRIFGWDDRSSDVKVDPAQPRQFNPLHGNDFFDIHLSRRGEDGSEAVAAVTHGDVVINAGRKSSQRVGWHSGETALANFDYEAQRLGVIEVFAAPAAPAAGGARKYDVRVRTEPLTDQIADDAKIAALLQPYIPTLKKRSKEHIAIEFWTMPECPGCMQLRPDLQKVAEGLAGRADVSVHFVLHKEKGKLASLHGDRELEEARVQALILKYYPEKIWEWLAWRESSRDTSWDAGAHKLGLAVFRLRGALNSGEADPLLEADYELMNRRHVDGTPSLVIANRVYDGALERLQILRVLCSLLDAPAPDVCKDVPSCFFDAQCKKRGFVGHCQDAGKPAARCDYSQAAVKVPTVVITDRENLHDNYEHILELLVQDLPGMQYRVLDLSDPEARGLIEQLKLSRLPAYILDPIAKTESNYADSVGKVITENKTAGKLIVQPFTVGSHRLLNRQRIKGRIDLFVSRFGKHGQEAVETALETQRELGATNSAPELIIHDTLYFKDPPPDKPSATRELAAEGGLAEVEEAARGAAVKRAFPDKFNDYLIKRGINRGSSYWDVALKAAGIDVAKVRSLAEFPSDEILKDLYAEAQLLKDIDGGGEITLLGENCEVIPMLSRADLREMMEKIGRRK